MAGKLSGSAIQSGTITSTQLSTELGPVASELQLVGSGVSLNVSNNALFSGNVGIGTGIPVEKLHINDGKIAVTGDTTTPTTGHAFFYKQSAGATISGYQTLIETGSAGSRQTRVTVDFNGNVGIGLTSPQTKSHISLGGINGLVIDSVYAGGAGSTEVFGNAANTVYNLVLRSSYNSNPEVVNNAGHKWGIILTGFNGSALGDSQLGKSAGVFAVSEDSGAGYNRKVGLSLWSSATDQNFAERVRISGDGNIGIGTTSPSCALDVVSTNAIRIPEGTTAQRPTPSTGMIRFNSSLRIFEGHSSAGKWEVIPTAQARFLNGSPSPISSTTNTTFRDMRTFTYTANGPKIISVGITAYNNSGAYYWIWRLYNSSKSAPVPILDCSPLPDNDVANGGGIAFLGGVHNSSAQPYVNFDMSGASDGDTIAIQMSNHTTGGGSVGGLVSSTQQLNLDKYIAFHGIVTGMSGTAYWGT